MTVLKPFGVRGPAITILGFPVGWANILPTANLLSNVFIPYPPWPDRVSPNEDVNQKLVSAPVIEICARPGIHVKFLEGTLSPAISA